MRTIGVAILFTANHNADVINTVSQLKNQGVPRSHIMLFHGSDDEPSIPESPINRPDKWTAATLSRTYAWVLREAASRFDYVVVLEDDLWLSPHFMTFVQWGVRVIDHAPDVAVVSAWNDNAVPEVKLSPSVVLRTTQFMGLGWVASSKTVAGFASAISAEPTRPWDLTVARHMLFHKKVSVFPQYPRVHHRTASFWKFDTLQVFTKNVSTLPGARWFAGNYNQYIRFICRNGRTYTTRNLRTAVEASGLPIPWTTSALTSKTYGEHMGVAVFPDQRGTQHCFNARPSI